MPSALLTSAPDSSSETESSDPTGATDTCLSVKKCAQVPHSQTDSLANYWAPLDDSDATSYPGGGV